MAFSSTASIVSTDLDNMLRGLYRSNANVATSGTGEDDLSSTTITGGTIGATGALMVVAAGTITGTNGQKDVRLKLGTSVVEGRSGTSTVLRSAATTDDWFILSFIFNTAANAQRTVTVFSTDSAATLSFAYGTAAVDTGSNQTIKVTGECANGGDTVTQTVFDVFQVQMN